MLFEEYYNRLILNEGLLETIPKKVLGLSTSIQDLPDFVPYGFWVDRHGNFLRVNTCSHDDGLLSIVNKAQDYLSKKGTPHDFSLRYMTLFQEGWARVVLRNKAVYYQLIEGGQLSQAQKKFLDFVKDLYDKEEVVEDS